MPLSFELECFDEKCLNRLDKTEERYRELEKLLGDAQVLADQSRYQKLAKEFSDITPGIDGLRQYREAVRQLEELDGLLKDGADSELRDLAKAEWKDLKERKRELEQQLFDFLNPKLEEKDQDIIMEIRAGTGGQEASLFAADLYRMYANYAEKKGWTVESMSAHESETGGYKEVVFSISGKGASRLLKWESGTHRVQRVPVTEASGRIHTSAATVAVLPEPEEVEVKIDPKDLKIDVYRSSGPGGQSVNTTDSAIRITHLPTGLVVVCQDERSQLKNRLKAMRVLRARLHEKIQRDNFEKTTKDRKAQVGSGDRSEKIRTYNFPERRVTDHRIGLTVYQLENVMDGDLEPFVNGLQEAALKAQQEKE